MQLKHIIAVTAVVFAALTPVAAAGPMIDGGPARSSDQAPATALGSSRFADQTALRVALEGRGWQQADRAPLVAITRPQSEGFDWSSAAVGASVLLGVALLGAAAVPAVRGRRKRSAAIA